jgi:opacity protein-like surface antigen
MWRVPKPSVILEWASTGGFFVLVLLLGPGLRAQLYIGGEAGWTGLSGQTDTISGITSPTARFNGGFNTGVRGGYEWGPWRFEEEYSYRQNGARDVVGMLLFGGARLSACSCYRRMIIAPAPRSTAVGYS